MDDTQIIQWTIIGSAVAIVLVMIGLGGIGVWVLKTAMNSVRFELKGDIAELKTELKGDIAELRTELKGDIAELRTELKGDIAGLRTELKGDIADAKAESKADIASLKLDVQSNRAEIIANRRLIARFALHRHGDDGLPVAPLTDSLDPPEGTAGGNNGEGNGD